MLHIKTEGDVKEFAPGVILRGEASWELQSPPSNVMVALIWYTEGKGTQDSGVGAQHTFENPASLERRQFSLTVPEAPYSCSGTLISIRWAIELSCDDDEDAVRFPILVSPWVTEVNLTLTESEMGA